MAGALLLAAPLLSGCVGGADASESTRLVIKHSSFSERHLTFERGETVTFVVVNRDPIDHELIVGPRDVQDHHEEGRKRRHHGEVPGEISVPAGEVAETTYTFERAGTLYFACHLPGHFAYGMHGDITVTP